MDDELAPDVAEPSAPEIPDTSPGVTALLPFLNAPAVADRTAPTPEPGATEKPPSETQVKLHHALSYYQRNAEDFWGPGSASYAVERTPVLSALHSTKYYSDLYDAAKDFDSGEPTDNSIYTVAQHLAKEEYHGHREGWDKFLDVSTKLAGFVGELALTGPATAGVRKSADVMIGGLAKKYLTGRIGAYVAPTVAKMASGAAGMGLRTPLLSGTYEGMAAQATGEDADKGYGTKDLTTAIAKGGAAALVNNVIMGASGAFGPKTVGGLVPWAKSTAAAVTGLEAAKDVSYHLGLGAEPGAGTNIAHGDFGKLMKDMPDALAFALLEAGQHAAPSLQARFAANRAKGLAADGPKMKEDLTNLATTLMQDQVQAKAATTAAPPAAAATDQPAAAATDQPAAAAATDQPEDLSSTGMKEMGSGLAKGIGDSLRDSLYEAYQRGSVKHAGRADKLLQVANAVGSGLSREQFVQLIEEADTASTGKKGKDYQDALRSVVGKWVRQRSVTAPSPPGVAASPEASTVPPEATTGQPEAPEPVTPQVAAGLDPVTVARMRELLPMLRKEGITKESVKTLSDARVMELADENNLSVKDTGPVKSEKPLTRDEYYDQYKHLYEKDPKYLFDSISESQGYYRRQLMKELPTQPSPEQVQNVERRVNERTHEDYGRFVPGALDTLANKSQSELDHASEVVKVLSGGASGNKDASAAAEKLMLDHEGNRNSALWEANKEVKQLTQNLRGIKDRRARIDDRGEPRSSVTPFIGLTKPENPPKVPPATPPAVEAPEATATVPEAVKPPNKLVAVTGSSKSELLDRIDRNEGDLTDQEKKVLQQRIIFATSFGELADDMGIPGKQTVANLEASGLKKLGHSGTIDQLHLAGRGGQAISEVEKGTELRGQDLHERGAGAVEHSARINQISDAQEAIDKIYKKQIKERNKGRKLTDERLAADRAEIDRNRRIIDASYGENQASEDQSGESESLPSDVTKRQSVEPSPVRPGSGAGVPEGERGPENAPAAVGTPAAGSEGPGGAAGAGSEASGGGVKSPLPKYVQKAFDNSTTVKERITAAAEADHIVFTPLAGTPEAQSAGMVSNEALRTLDERYDGLKSSGIDPRYPADIARVNKTMDATAKHIAEQIAVLRKMGKTSEADWYEKVGLPLVEEARRDLGGVAEARQGFGRPLTGQEKGKGAIGGGSGEPETASTPRPSETALANARVDADRAQQQLPPLLSQAALENPEVWQRAMDRLDRNPQAGAELVDELAAKSRATTADENALLLQRRIALRNEHSRVIHDYLDAFQQKADAITMDQLESREQDLASQVEKTDRVVRDTGSEWGRAGQFRRQLAKEDFSLSGMMGRARAAAGRDLRPGEKVEIARIQKKVEDTTTIVTATEETLAGQIPTIIARAKTEGVSHGEAIVDSTAFKDDTKAKAAAAGAQGEFASILSNARRERMTIFDKIKDYIERLRQAEVFSSPATLVKIAASSLARLSGIATAEQAAGSGWRKAPWLVKIAALAAHQGTGLDVGTEMASYKSAFTDGMKDAYQSTPWREGMSDLDKQFGGKSGQYRDWISWIGELHGALKAPAVRAEFTRSLINRINSALGEGSGPHAKPLSKDPLNPLNLLRMGAESYQDAIRAKFGQPNQVVDAVNNVLKKWEAKDASPLAQGAALTAKVLLPVRRIPTNLVAEAFQYATGAVTGNVYAGLLYARGIESLKPAEAESVMRQLKKGSLGAAAMTLGYFLKDSVGGFFNPEDKNRPKTDVKEGGIRTPVGDVSSTYLHNPLLEVVQMGASIARVENSIKKGEHRGLAQGIASGATGLLEEVPMVRESTKGIQVFTPGQRGRYFGELTKSLAVPQFVQWLARRTDTDTGNPVTGETLPRKDVGLKEAVQSGIPGWRQGLPIDTKRYVGQAPRPEAPPAPPATTPDNDMRHRLGLRQR